MILQFEPPEIINLDSIMGVLSLFILIIIMIVLFKYLRVFLVILTVFLFSLIIGMIAIQDGSLPFSPYLQMFFMMFQGVIFLITSLGAYTDFKEGGEFKA